MAELARLQTQFGNALLKPGAAAPDLFSGNLLRAARCQGLYRGNLAANWDKSLSAAYPVVRQLVGDGFFHALAQAYGREVPSSSGDLNRFGAGFADFLAGFAPLSEYPYMTDVARLEWLLHQAHSAADSMPLNPEALRTLDIEAITSLRFELRPGHALFHSPWDALGIWQAHQSAAAALPRDVDRSSRCLVCRPRWRAELLSVTRGEFVALSLIDSGAPLGEALEPAAQTDPDFDPGTAFPRWLGAGIFAPYRFDPPT